jgi:hypothetical protein
MRKMDPVSAAIVIAVSSTVPRLKSLADRYGRAFEKALWPKGAPPGLTWTIVQDQQITALRRSIDELVAFDMKAAKQRGAPWPGGASIRKETAVRIQLAEELIARAGSMKMESAIDAMLFQSGEVPPPKGFAKLVELSGTLMLAMSRRMTEESLPIEPIVVGKMVARMLGEMLAMCRGLTSLLKLDEVGKQIDKMLELMGPLHEAIKKMESADLPDEAP